MEWIARLVGAFYMFAGVVTIRQAVLNWRMERVFGAFLGTPPAEKAADVLLSLIAVLTFASGLALVFLTRWAPPAFVACWLVQAGYLLWASRWYPPENEELARYRRQTINACAVYAVATVAVLWWRGTGVLR